MINRRSVLTGMAALPLGIAGLPYAAGASAPLSVVATTGMIADAVRQIAGDAVEVTGLFGPSIDPHSYRQTRSDIVAMARADLVLWHGLYLEAQMEPFLLDLAKRKPVVAVAEALAKPDLIASEDYAERFDPHVWMDPALWTGVLNQIGAALVTARPELETVIAPRLDAYAAQVAGLGTYGRDALGQLPTERRVLITAHDAFAYFGRAFDMDVIGVQGISTQSEAGLHRIGTLVDLLVERDVRAVFVESSVSDRNMRALIEGAAQRGHKVRLGGELYSDAMGPDGTYEGTYIGMIDHNITTIARALGADLPVGGLNNRLAAGG